METANKKPRHRQGSCFVVGMTTASSNLILDDITNILMY